MQLDLSKKRLEELNGRLCAEDPPQLSMPEPTKPLRESKLTKMIANRIKDASVTTGASEVGIDVRPKRQRLSGGHNPALTANNTAPTTAPVTAPTRVIDDDF